MRTPLKNVRRLGSAKAGTETFIMQRFTGLANVGLTLFGVWLVVSLANADHATVKSTIAHPVVGLLLVLLVVSAAVHMRIGIKEIIEDYIHHEGTKIVLLILNTVFAILVAAISLYAILKLTFGA